MKMVLQSSFRSVQITKNNRSIGKTQVLHGRFSSRIDNSGHVLGCLDGMISSLVIWKRLKYILGLAHALYSETKEISTRFNGAVSNLGESCKCIANTVTRFCDVM